jgi:hypothetical protein
VLMLATIQCRAVCCQKNVKMGIYNFHFSFRLLCGLSMFLIHF